MVSLLCKLLRDCQGLLLSLGTAIETPISVTVRLSVRTDRPYTKTPHFTTRLPAAETPPEYYATTGVEPDLREATRSAVRHMIEYLCATYQMSRVDAYMLCSIAGDLRLHEVVCLCRGCYYKNSFHDKTFSRLTCQITW